jgi:DNA polymerase III delta subunit
LPAGAAKWQAAGRLKINPDAAELAMRRAKKFEKEQLTSGLQALYEADSLLKSGVPNPRAVMEFLVMQLAR